MGVINGQAVSAEITNPAFIDANQDDATLGKLGLHNIGSGPFIDNTQQALNNIFDTTGADESTVATTYAGAPASTVTSGVTHEAAIVELAVKFDPSLGHTHTGAAGDGPILTSASIGSQPLRGSFARAQNLLSVTGATWDVSTEMSGKTPSTGSSIEGVVVNTPYNKIIIRQATGANAGDPFEDGLGNEVYGRLTESVGVWTLSFYVLIGTTQTAYTFSSSSDIAWYYQELFKVLSSSAPVYSEQAFIPSDNTTADVITATDTLQGKVKLADALELPGNIAATASSGTANASVANADHTHKGVYSLGKFGDATKLFGAVDLDEGSNISISRVGQRLILTALSSGSGSLINAFQEIPSGVVDNSNVTFTLSQAPQTPASLLLHLDGVPQAQGVDYTLSGATITMAIAPNFAQQLYAFYGGDAVVPVQETPTGTINGVNTTFTLSQTPVNADALLLFLDSTPLTITDYTMGGTNVVLNVAPNFGQQLYAFYLSGGIPVIPTGNQYVEYHTLSGAEVTAKSFTLAATPGTPSKVLVDVIGGGAQQYAVDFTISGNSFNWATLGLDGILASGDVLRLAYFS